MVSAHIEPAVLLSFAATAASPRVDWLEEMARPVALHFGSEWAAAWAIVLTVIQLVRGFYVIPGTFSLSRTSTNIYPCLLRL